MNAESVKNKNGVISTKKNNKKQKQIKTNKNKNLQKKYKKIKCTKQKNRYRGKGHAKRTNRTFSILLTNIRGLKSKKKSLEKIV